MQTIQFQTTDFKSQLNTLINSTSKVENTDVAGELHIAIVSPYPPSMGTLNEYAYHLVESLKDCAGVSKISILTDHLPEGQSYPKTDNSKINLIPTWEFNKLSNVIMINRKLRKIKADVVLYNIQFLSFGDRKIPAALGLLGPWLNRLFKIPSVVLLHNLVEMVDYDSAGITQSRLMSSIYNAIGSVLTWVLLKCNLMAVTMEKYVDVLEAKYGADNVVHMPHGAFESHVAPEIVDYQGPKRLMTFGKFGTYKKVETLIRAIDLVQARRAERIELVIAGSDNPNAKGYLQSVEDLFPQHGNLTFTGYVAEEDIPSLFTDCTAIALPYTSTTGSSGVLHQAGGFAKAAILPNIGDLKLLVENEGYRGVFFEAENIESMADAVEEILYNNDKRKEIAAANYLAAQAIPLSQIAKMYVGKMLELIEPA